MGPKMAEENEAAVSHAVSETSNRLRSDEKVPARVLTTTFAFTLTPSSYLVL